MAKITYTNKVNGQSEIDADDMNSIKASVNALYDLYNQGIQTARIFATVEGQTDFIVPNNFTGNVIVTTSHDGQLLNSQFTTPTDSTVRLNTGVPLHTLVTVNYLLKEQSQ